MCLRLREQCLRSEITSVSRVALVLFLRFVASEYAGVQTFPVDRKHSDCSKALRNPHKFDLCVLASFSCHVYAETQGRKLRPVAALTLQLSYYYFIFLINVYIYIYIYIMHLYVLLNVEINLLTYLLSSCEVHEAVMIQNGNCRRSSIVERCYKHIDSLGPKQIKSK